MNPSKISGYVVIILATVLFALALFGIGINIQNSKPQPEYTIKNTMKIPPLTTYKVGNIKFLKLWNKSINIETISTMNENGEGTWIHLTNGEIHAVSYTIEEIQKAIQKE